MKNVLKKLKRKLTRPFRGSGDYWTRRYAKGDNSGEGSYSKLAEFKAEVINGYGEKYDINDAIELGCGDGNNASQYHFDRYIGLDISSKAIELCRKRLGDRNGWSFYDINEYREGPCKLSLSLDVIYHLVEDEIYDQYMHKLFELSKEYVCIYSSNTNENFNDLPHVRNRKFSDWIQTYKPEWHCDDHIPNRFPYNGNSKTGSRSEFYLYRRKQL